MLILQVLYGIVVMILVVVVLMAVMGKRMMLMLMMLCDVEGKGHSSILPRASLLPPLDAHSHISVASI